MDPSTEVDDHKETADENISSVGNGTETKEPDADDKKYQNLFDMNLAKASSTRSVGKRLIGKMGKNKTDDDVHIKRCKANLESLRSMHSIVNIATKLHVYQSTHLQAMQTFSSAIHSTIDLGRDHATTNNKNKNYFGQYLKMMASTMHCVSQLYGEYNDNLRKHMIEPMESFTKDKESDIQACIHLKHEYNRTRNMVNKDPNHKNKLELEDIQNTFVSQTKNLIQLRHDQVTCELQLFDNMFREYAHNKSQYIHTKRHIKGYDEMKERLRALSYQVKKEIINLRNSSEWSRCIASANDEWSIIFFHRNKFPPSMKFLKECVAPLSATYNGIRFIIVHHTCHELLEQYDVNVFPTCVVFLGDAEAQQYERIIGNSPGVKDELQLMCKQIWDTQTNVNQMDTIAE
eukprot:287702_1